VSELRYDGGVKEFWGQSFSATGPPRLKRLACFPFLPFGAACASETGCRPNGDKGAAA
jgi:hypothetical protein